MLSHRSENTGPHPSVHNMRLLCTANAKAVKAQERQLENARCQEKAAQVWQELQRVKADKIAAAARSKANARTMMTCAALNNVHI